jgi:hypothetical protein
LEEKKMWNQFEKLGDESDVVEEVPLVDLELGDVLRLVMRNKTGKARVRTNLTRRSGREKETERTWPTRIWGLIEA